MKSLPKISIVIPSYNKVKYIQETLDSIASQNYPNLEVIIQDGGSTDGTVEIIRQFAKKYPKTIKWISKKDKGQVDAINKGLKKAIGDVLTFINADDVYEKGALKKVGKYFAEYPNTPWLAGKGRTINGEGEEISILITFYKNLLLKINIYLFLLTVNYFMQPSVFLSRNAYQKYGPFTGAGEYVMEYDMWLRIGKEEMPAILDTHLSSFRITKETTSAVLFEKILTEDYQVASKYTKNLFILFLHKVHNLGRVITLLLLKRKWIS